MAGLDHKTIADRDIDVRTALHEGDAIIRDAHVAGADGSQVVQRRTALVDRVLREIHGRLTASGPMPGLIATGGYGRGELNPQSDIDIMFLCRDQADRQRAPEMLYQLWDGGLDVGYSVRTVRECVELARQDIKIRTSLIESRPIACDDPLYGSFLKAMNSDVFYWKASSFITAKVAERNATRQQYGGSVYLREPNIKEGPGGLRDIHTAFWVAFTHFRVPSLVDLIPRGILTEGQYAVFLRSRNFLWKLRNELHYLSGRKNDHLTYELQERTAKNFGYRDSTHLLAVERFMKSYFLHAKNVREFSSLVVDAALRKPPRRWFVPVRRLGPFSLVDRTLVPASEDVIPKDPVLIMQAFQIAQSRHAVLSDRLKAMVREARFGDEVRASTAAAAVFQSILDNPDILWETLTLMKDLRFLGRYIPEFRSIQSLAKHDYYHQYTVDEHILLAIRSLQDLWGGLFPALTILRDAFKSLKKRWVLMLAVLLHDLGKAYRSEHEYRGVDLAGGILARLGVAGEDRERVLFLVRNHLLMSSLSQRRELSEQKVIADFARRVHDGENLRLLYLLTYADISAVNPRAWTQWKAALLQDLYLKTMRYFDASARTGEEDQTKREAAYRRIRREAEGLFSPREIDGYLAVMPEKYLLFTPTQKVIDHMGMMKALPEEKLVIGHRHNRQKGYTELTVCAYDAYGMFYRTAGTIAAKNLNILRAQVFTTKNGVMIDTFQITDADGNISTYEDAWESVKTELRAALTSQRRPPEPGLYTARKMETAASPPMVAFDNDTSDFCTIIDVAARDRVGLLYRIAKTLFDLNLDVASAKIVTEGARVMDSFYVTDLFRRKIDDSDRLSRIKEALLRVME